MKTFSVYANGTFMGEYEGIDCTDAILGYVQDAGYIDIDTAANALGQTYDEFVECIECEEVTDDDAGPEYVPPPASPEIDARIEALDRANVERVLEGVQSREVAMERASNCGLSFLHVNRWLAERGL